MTIPQALESAIFDSIQYLDSEAARQRIRTDVYWPKWDSPWWHMAALHEMGQAHRIPKSALHLMCERLSAQLVPFLFTREMPQGRDARFDLPCPCQLGNIFQIISAAGANADEILPWARDWFMRYQMEDGGMSCDETAYDCSPQASSIVGMIAPLEAVLHCTNRPWTPQEIRFLDRGATCLLDRELRLGCSVAHNAEEKLDEQSWLQLCFPRFYLYDVLRGLHFILQWSKKRGQPLPKEKLQVVINALQQQSAHGELRIGRKSYAGVPTRFRTSSGEWVRKEDPALFPLLEKVSQVGDPSPFLTSQWRECQALLHELLS